VEVPSVEAVNPVGSGDAFNAGFSLALLDDRPIEDAFVRGVAAGAANALTLGAGAPDIALVRELERAIDVRRIEREGIWTG
jgi:tagatose 6-phosphate kinase